MSLNELIEELQKKLRRKTQEIESLREQLSKYEGGVQGQSGGADVEALTRELKLKDEKIEELERKLAASGGEGPVPPSGGIGGLVTELQTKIKRRETRISELEAEVSSLRNEVENWKASATATAGGSASADPGKIAELEVKLKTLEDELAFKDKLIESLKNDPFKTPALESLASGELEAELKLKEKTIRRLRESKSVLEAQLKEMNEARGRDTGALEAEVQGLRSTVEDLQKKLEEKDKVLEGLRVSIAVGEADDKKDSAVLEAKLKEARIQIQKLNDVINQKNKDILRLEEYRGRGFIERFEEERKKLEEELERERQSHQNLYARISELEREQQESGTRQQMLRIREIKNLYEGLKRETRLYQAQIQEMRQKLAENSLL
ncbi:MAG: hypothetical protein ACTSU5_00235 [Promethearchaeota archaeon]